MPTFAAAGYPAWAFSLRGHGKSAGSVRNASIADYLDDLRGVLARFARSPVLVGHSLGAFLIQHLLAERDDFPAAVFLASIPPSGTMGLAWRTFRQRPRVARHVMTKWDVYPFLAWPTPDGRRFFSAGMDPATAEDYMRRFTRESFRAVAVDALVLRLPRVRPRRTPLLVLGGAQDTLFTPDEVHRTARAYGTTATIFPAMGHDLMLDPGWEHVAGDMLAWLKTPTIRQS